mmetsp:Transcript_6007/g.6865  ORF Transcript_6007/g.6865 Transcript_6007/m.6865 type:complete len:221 (-) Transcript_6007:339-1001(-)|eukprot:CAMPEP_0197853062 /NCGR_PEP_ID=MMETSP1438-20131217/21999_1 /TAXON_ID=1461541 /ORGANISM="Pterosperma sp., Strain CCMP1384" /LENGTH=220 /DNA_ID=CAMNT_0043467339 /DNA_START=106 /DNA_END=768 /DNA_ORIENTATION=+
MEPPPEEKEEDKSSIIFVLDSALLEVAKIGKGYVLLNSDEHAAFMRKHKKDPSLYRPDILHQAMLAILDSPLNKSGRLKSLYISASKNVLIEVNPQIRIPRTFHRFCGLMVQLLQKLSIRASNGPDKLMKIIKSPVTKYIPDGCKRVGMSYSAPEVKKLPDYVDSIEPNSTTLFVVGAFAHGKVDVSYVDTMISISQYPLSAACCIGRICNTLENKWNIV